MYKSVNISVEWAKSVTYTEFKKNSIIKMLEPKKQKSLYEGLTNKKVRTN